MACRAAAAAANDVAMSATRRPAALAFAASLALCAAARAGSSGGETRVFRYLMGTSMQVQAFGSDEAARRQAIDEAFAAIAEVDRLMSNYRPDSELTHINASAASGAVTVSDP